MSGSDKPLPLPGSGHAHALGIFPMPPYPYFIPHMLGGISPPALPALPLSGYSTPSPASCPTAASERIPRLVRATPTEVV
ncbi:hypothetical protein Q7C36_017709 [Tachysurus vachellii]|uniref:Retinoic acid receptor alpha n=1 Tax=Tachysurus vachellii TaxID=175792 RepID=A0AA88S8X1_TACVA|nr:hypothetical protein Q7C36_017709 [Tachysurus vachellii]